VNLINCITLNGKRLRGCFANKHWIAFVPVGVGGFAMAMFVKRCFDARETDAVAEQD